MDCFDGRGEVWVGEEKMEEACEVVGVVGAVVRVEGAAIWWV